MSNTECKRCGDGSGHIARYAHVQGGRCFACGRVVGGQGVARPSDRARAIGALQGLLAAAAREAAEGTIGAWIAAVSGEDACPSLPGTLAAAPADVRDRAVAAFARLGVQVG
jgi:hypothetical protein